MMSRLLSLAFISCCALSMEATAQIDAGACNDVHRNYDPTGSFHRADRSTDADLVAALRDVKLRTRAICILRDRVVRSDFDPTAARVRLTRLTGREVGVALAESGELVSHDRYARAAALVAASAIPSAADVIGPKIGEALLATVDAREPTDSENLMKQKLSRSASGAAVLDSVFGSGEGSSGWAVGEIRDAAGLAAASLGRNAADDFTRILFSKWDKPLWQAYDAGTGVVLAVANSSDGNRRARELAASENPNAGNQALARLLANLPVVEQETLEALCSAPEGWLSRSGATCTSARWRAGDKAALAYAVGQATGAGLHAIEWSWSLLLDYGADGIGPLRKLAREPYPASRGAILVLCNLGSLEAGQDIVEKSRMFLDYPGNCLASERTELARFAPGFVSEEKQGLWASGAG